MYVRTLKYLSTKRQMRTYAYTTITEKREIIVLGAAWFLFDFLDHSLSRYQRCQLASIAASDVEFDMLL